MLATIAMVFVFAACNSNNEKTKVPSEANPVDTPTKKEEMKPVAEQLYSCPMHPEVIGKKDEKCSKCGMKLTVPVKNSKAPN